MQAWEVKAHKLIGMMARESYERANRLPSGQLRARHVPYSIPEDAEALIACLADPVDGERRAKALFHEFTFRKAGAP